MLGVIKHNFVDRSKETIIPLYKSSVRPHLEYWCQVWNPYFNKDIKLIGVQHRPTKLVHDMQHPLYDNRLEKLGLMRLSDRRARGDLIETFKTASDMYDLKEIGKGFIENE